MKNTMTRMIAKFVVVASLLVAPCAQAEDTVPVVGGDLWDKYIMNKPNPRIFDTKDDAVSWEVVERIVVIRQDSGLTPLQANLATLCLYTGGVGITDCALTEQSFIRLGITMKGGPLNEDETAKIKTLYSDTAKEFEGRIPEALKGKVIVGKSYGIRDAKLLAMTFGNRDVIPALKELARVHGHVPIVETRHKPSFDKCKEAIDKRVPFLTKSQQGQYRICFGYLAVEGRQHLVLVDCTEISFEKRPIHFSKKDLESTDPRVVGTIEMQKKILLTTDFETETQKHLVQGIQLTEYRSELVEDTFFIYGWEKSAEGSWDKVQKILGTNNGFVSQSWLQ